METFKSSTDLVAKNAKIIMISVMVLAVLIALAGTAGGRHILEQIGIRSGVAQTVENAADTIAKTSDALKSFVSRSPGERGPTDALKGKAQGKRLARAQKPKPTQRALGKVFDQPVSRIIGPAVNEPLVNLAPAAVTTADLAPSAPALPVNAAFFAPVIGGGFVGGTIGGGGGGGGGGIGGGGPGGGGGGGISNPPTTPPVASAVPEPSMWILLLIGFGAVGASMRRARARSLTQTERAGICPAL